MAGATLSAALAVSPAAIEAGCHADRRRCRVKVVPFGLVLAPGARLEQLSIELSGSTVYEFRTDVSNPPAVGYIPELPAAGFAAVCKSSYVATVRAKDTADPALQPIGESAPFVCPAPSACPPAPAEGCVTAARARLDVSEAKPGREKLAVSLSRLSEETETADFGDPVAGDTLYDLCVYDGSNGLAAALSVERAGALCGAATKPCWKPRRGGGFAYRDPDGSADGTLEIALVAGPKGQLKLWAANQAKRGRTALPLGTAAALANEVNAVVQLHASGAACFSAALATVKKADGIRFKATTP